MQLSLRHRWNRLSELYNIAVVRRRHDGGKAVVGGKNSRGGGEALTRDFGRLRPPFAPILAPFSLFFSHLQNLMIVFHFS